MPIMMLAFLFLLGGAGIGYTMLWVKLVNTREELDRLKATQDELIDLVSTKLIEDDSAQQFLQKLKVGRARLRPPK